MSVYSHRPVPPPPPGSTHFRVSELLDAVKVEVDSISQEANILKLQRDEYEHKISAQINEMNAFQQNLYELERTHQKVKQQYEDEILRLRRELDQRAPNPSSSVPPHPQHQQQQQQPPPIHQQQQQPQQPPPQLPPSQIPQPPNIGPSQSNLFGGIIGAQGNLTMGGTPGGNPSAPLQMQDPQQSQRQQPHLPYGASQIQPIPHPGKRLRPEGDTPPSGQQQPPSGYPPQNVMNQPPQMGMGMYDGFSSASGGLKKEPPHHGPSTLPGMNAISSATQHSQPPTQSLQHPLQMHHPQQPSHPHQLPHTQQQQQQQHGTQLSQHPHQHQQTHPHPHQHQLQHQHHPNSGAMQPLSLANSGPVPNQNAKLATTSSQPVTPTSTANAIPTSTSSASSNLISGPGDDISKRKQMTGNAYPNALPQNQQSPQQLSSQHQQSQNQHHRNPLAAGPVAPVAGTPPAGQLQAQGNGTNLSVNDTLSDMDPENVPAHLKREGKDWFAIFNPKFPRTLDVGLVHTLDHSSVVCCVRFSHDGKYLATGCNRSAQIYDVLTGHKVCVLADETVGKDGDLYIRSVCFSPDGKYLATGAEDKQIRIWDIGKKRIRNLFTGHEQDIYSLDFSKDGRLVVSGSGDRTARVWDMETGKALHTLSIEDTGSKDAGVTSVAISPDGRLVAAGSLDKMVRVWDAMTGYFLDRLEGHKDSVYSVAFAPDGKCIVSGSLDKTLKMWDLSGLLERTNGSARNGGASMASVCRTTFVGHKDFVLSVACSPCGNWVVSGSKDRGVQFWDPRTAQTQFMLQGHKNSVISVALSPVGGQFATGSGDCRARIWKHENFSG